LGGGERFEKFIFFKKVFKIIKKLIILYCYNNEK